MHTQKKHSPKKHSLKRHSPNTYPAANHGKSIRRKHSRRFCRLCTKCMLSVSAFTFTLLAADGPMLRQQPDFWEQHSAGTTAQFSPDAAEPASSLAKTAGSQASAEDTYTEDPARQKDTAGNSAQPENGPVNLPQDSPDTSGQAPGAEYSQNDSVQGRDHSTDNPISPEPDTASQPQIFNTDERTRYSAQSHADSQIYYSYAENPAQFSADNGTQIQSIPERQPAEQFIDTTADDETEHLTQVSSDWNLILVNPWNEIPDDYEISLTQLPNGHSIDSRCYPALTEMMNACRDAGLHPLICSSYRSAEKQKSLFQERISELLAQGYSKKDARAKAAVSVARPGTSEHQIGLAVDIVDSSYQALDSRQEYTPVQQWLMENSWKYGFILRYPNAKSRLTGIIYEPWHYRYVGLEAAQEIYERGICLEEYLEGQL